MPTVTASASTKVLVTGANGFIAVWLVQNLLVKGYAVRGTVRSASKAKFLEDKFKQYGDKLEIVVVEDITADGAFDDAVKGVDAIEHTASPFHFNAVDPQELLGPAIKGTVGILESTRKYGSQVKRVVVTSSCASVLNPNLTEPTVYSEKDWNTTSVEEVERLGKDATQAAKYRASKTLAERAAWDFVEKHKDSISWDLTTINPPFIFGPIIHDIPSPDALNTSSADWYNTVIKGTRTTAEQLKFGSAWIDVRDLADAFVLALEKEAAGGERIIVSAGPWIWQDWLSIANALNPPPTKHTLVKGIPELSDKPVYLTDYETSKASRILGLGDSLKYRTKEQTVIDSLRDFEARGW